MSSRVVAYGHTNGILSATGLNHESALSVVKNVKTRSTSSGAVFAGVHCVVIVRYHVRNWSRPLILATARRTSKCAIFIGDPAVVAWNVVGVGEQPRVHRGPRPA